MRFVKALLIDPELADYSSDAICNALAVARRDGTRRRLTENLRNEFRCWHGVKLADAYGGKTTNPPGNTWLNKTFCPRLAPCCRCTTRGTFHARGDQHAMGNDTTGADKSLTISQCCAIEEISRAEFYKIRRAGRGPVVVYPGPGCPRITAKARRDWHCKLEAEGPGAREVGHQPTTLRYGNPNPGN